MRAFTDFLVVMTGFLFLGCSIAFGNWLGSQPLFGWVAFGSLLAIAIWGLIVLVKESNAGDN
jgi:hypothetical protein